MVSLEQLLDLRTDTLHDAADAWTKAADTVAAHGTDFAHGVVDKAGATTWAGAAASAANDQLTRLTSTVSGHADAMRSIATTLHAGANGLGTAQTALRTAMNSARQFGIDFGADGSVRIDPQVVVAMITDPAKQAAIPQLVSQFGKAITEALNDATATDTRTAAALQAHARSAGGVTDMAAPEPMLLPPGGGGDTTDPAADAKAAAALAEQEPYLDAQQEAQLQAYLDEEAEDPTFATDFLNDLGPQGLLALTGILASKGESGGAEQTFAADLQGQLGIALSVATDSSAQPHLDPGWISRLESFGKQKIDIGLYSYQPYGYQLLGVLLHSGYYSSDFLNSVGDDMVRFEKQNPAVWATNEPEGAMYNGFRLNLVDGQGAGWDPMTGLMASMSENKQAAETFFDPAHSDNLDYLLGQRVWSPDVAMGTIIPNGYQNPGTGLLGDALQNAATGGTHTPTDAHIMSETVKVLAEQRDGAIPDNMKQSIGGMVSAYIGDVNKATAVGGDMTASGYGNWTDPALPGATDAHAVFSLQDINKVIASASTDPHAFVRMANAEKAYAGIQLQHTAGDTGQSIDVRRQAIEAEGHTASTVLGEISQNYSTAVQKHNTDVVNAYNSAISTDGAIANFVVGKTIGAIPVVGNLAAQGAEAYVNAVVSGSQQDSSTMNHDELLKDYYDGHQAIGDIAFQAMWQHTLWPSGDAPQPPLVDSNGNPIDLNTINDSSNQAEHDAMQTWTSTDGYQGQWQNVLNSISDGYELGWLQPS